MERIKFKYENSQQRRILQLSTAVISILVALGIFIQTIDAPLGALLLQISIIIGFLGITGLLVRMYRYKNFVYGNKDVILIRVKATFGKALKLDNIQEVKLEHTTLEILKYNRKKIKINLEHIHPEDQLKLEHILKMRTVQR